MWRIAEGKFGAAKSKGESRLRARRDKQARRRRTRCVGPHAVMNQQIGAKLSVNRRLCRPPVLRRAAHRGLGRGRRLELNHICSAVQDWQNAGISGGSSGGYAFVAAVAQESHELPNLSHGSENTNCGLTLRSSGPPPARRLGREALRVIIRLAAKPPCRWRPLSSNVRPQRSSRASVTRSQEQMQFKLRARRDIRPVRREVNAGSQAPHAVKSRSDPSSMSIAAHAGHPSFDGRLTAVSMLEGTSVELASAAFKQQIKAKLNVNHRMSRPPFLRRATALEGTSVPWRWHQRRSARLAE